MKTVAISSAAITERIEFTDNFFTYIEAAGNVQLSEEMRECIRQTCGDLQRRFELGRNQPRAGDVEQLLRKLTRRLRDLKSCIAGIIDQQGVAEKAALVLLDVEWKGGHRFNEFTSQVTFAHYAAGKALKTLPEFTFGGDGPNQSMPGLDSFVIDLAEIFEVAGGKASVRWADYDEIYKSEFLDFVHAILNRFPNELRIAQKQAIGAHMKRILTVRNSKVKTAATDR